MTELSITRNALGQLVYRDAAGIEHAGILPVHAFPLSAPHAGIALITTDGHELLWLDTLEGVPQQARALLETELARREFMPKITRIVSVASFATPSAWQIETDRGLHILLLKSEDDIRRLPERGLLIADSHGLHYRIPDTTALDRASRKLLDRFL